MINEDLFVYDFKQFSNVKTGLQTENEMDFHLTLKENGKSELLLHPVMELFLHMKWQLRNASMITNMAINLLFVIFLSLLSQKYLALTTCEPIDETCFHGPENITICDSIMKCHKKSIRTAKERPYPLEPICEAIGKDWSCWWVQWDTVIVMVFLLGIIIREVLELNSKNIQKYFWSFENILQITIISLTIGFFISSPVNIEVTLHLGRQIAWEKYKIKVQ